MSELISIKSSRFGDLEVPQSSVIEILGGVLGFPNDVRFVLLEYNPPFSWLQSVDNDSLAFAVVNAAEFGEEYHVVIPWGDADLGLDDDAAIAILNLVTVRPDPTMTTVNLKAPIVVCLKTMKGRQVILDDEKYPVRFPLWSASE